MARLFVFECKCGKWNYSKRVEYTPPSNSISLGGARYKIDPNIAADHDGYPLQTTKCPECGEEVTSQNVDMASAPPVYFNYMGDDD